MRLLTNLCAAAMGVVLTTAVSCESDDTGEGRKDGSTDAAQVVCGGTACTTATGAEFNQVTACCTAADSCGLQASFTSQCLTPSQPGAFDITCAPFAPPIGEQMDGCCGPNGCGALNAFVGCISNADLGRATVACNYDPTNDCAIVADIPCDGAEDCAAGEHCCGESVSGITVRFGCFPSCEALEADAGTASWFELCHAGDTCETAGATCHSTSSLPASLGRCSVTGFRAAPEGTSNPGEVHCGTGVCGAGEKCCLRNPNDPYCAPSPEMCRCHPTSIADGGGVDASNLDGG